MEDAAESCHQNVLSAGSAQYEYVIHRLKGKMLIKTCPLVLKKEP